MFRRLFSSARASGNYSFGVTRRDLDAVAATEAISRLVSLDHATQAERNRHQMRSAMAACRRTGANDTGSPEVQIAAMTVRMQYLQQHSKKHIHDYHSQRHLVKIM